MNSAKFKPLFYHVLLVSLALFVAVILFNMFGDHTYDIRKSIDGGGVVFFFVILLLAELLAYLIFRFFQRLISYLNNFYVAVLVSVFSPVLLIAIGMFIRQY